MRIAVVGTGYVGLVTGTCFAEAGNDVTCIDTDPNKIARLLAGQIPIYEPGLQELVEKNVRLGRLHFTIQHGDAVPQARVIFLAVGTPPRDDGSANLDYLWQAVADIAPHLAPNAIVVTKSTVPVGTNGQLHDKLQQLTRRAVDTASNPEFLREGAALEDFMRPDRVVVGVRRSEVGDVLRELYSTYLRQEQPYLVMSPESAELTKYVANAMLATKISFINEMANVCERAGANIDDVRRGIGHDNRIGFKFLFPGVGYGGSCFPKDVRELIARAQSLGVDAPMLTAVNAVNEAQKHVLFRKVHEHFQGQLAGRTLAVWGLAFKPQTDDIREAPALVLIDELLAAGCRVQVYDPEAMSHVERLWGDRLVYAQHPNEALDGADALAIVTEWRQFYHPDFIEIKRRLKQPVIFDGRNVYDLSVIGAAGFTYYSIGRPVVRGA